MEVLKEFSKFIEVIREDWTKLANFVKFCLIVGLSCILIMFAAIPDMIISGKSIYFWLVISALIFIVILPSLYWLHTGAKVWYYRRMLPLKDIGEKFQFAWVEGHDAVLIIYGRAKDRKKKARWIENGRTMYDLNFGPYYRKFTAAKEKLSGDDLKDYTLKKGIRTRRSPGTLSKQDT